MLRRIYILLILVTLCVILYIYNKQQLIQLINKNNLSIQQPNEVRAMNQNDLIYNEDVAIEDFETPEYLNISRPYDFVDPELKYILMWTSDKTFPFVFLKSGQEAFLDEECDYVNCFISNDRQYLADFTRWDAVLFHAPEIVWMTNEYDFDTTSFTRSVKQKFVFTSIESAHNYPLCNNKFNGFFNWTWTYKTNSDFRWGYVDIRDIDTLQLIGPKRNMSWIAPMKDISEDVKYKLSTKSKAAAWLVSNCATPSKREHFVAELQTSLSRYNLTIDIFGQCGSHRCNSTEEYHSLIERDYYFYLSLENSFAEDYVTEKLIHALNSYAIPIVLGGADYTRFLPPGSYIDSIKIDNVDAVADLMYELINDRERYGSYFRWTQHYFYQRDIETPETRAPCRLCEALNNKDKVEKQTIYENLQEWWNEGIPNSC